MGEVKEPSVQERKINPIAKPNKRFLGRTLNSMLSHNKRKNDRTQENCRKKLKELDERRELINRMKSRSRSGSWELVLSSSSDEDHSKETRKPKKHERKIKHKKHKKTKKKKNKSKKDRRESSCSSSSSDSRSESSCTTSQSTARSKRRKLRKSSKPKKRKIVQSEMNTNEGATEDIYYEPDINAAIEFDAALMANNYRQHQIQQLLYYNALMVGNETSEIEALNEELRVSDAEVIETRKEKLSICSPLSSLNFNESDSDDSEVLQISLSSATSSGSEAKSNRSIQNKKVKRKYPKECLPSDSSDEVIWELDSDSSNTDKISEIKGGIEKQTENDCICITSDSETTTDDNSQSESSTNEKDIESANITNVSNNICHAAAETVTILSSSDSEVEIIILKDADESEQKLTDASTPASEKQADLVLRVSETNAISIPKESLSTVADDSVATVPDKISNLSVEVNSLITTTERSLSSIKVGATEAEKPICTVQEQQALMKETDSLEADKTTSLTFVASTDSITEALCEPNSSDITSVGMDVETTALKSSFEEENIISEAEMNTKVVNMPTKESVGIIPSDLSSPSYTYSAERSSPKAMSSSTSIATIDNAELI